jgi:hypothetical protein
MAFPISKAELWTLEDESRVPTNIVIDIIVHRIANEVFKLAAEGKSRYSCDVKTEDVLQMMERLLKMFPDSSITIQGNVFKNFSNMEISWL